MALNNQEKFFKEFILFAKDKETTPEELEKHLSQVVTAYVAENLKGTKLEGSKVTVQKETFVEAAKDGNTPIENPRETQANAVKIGDDFIWKTGLEDIVEDLLYNEEEGRAADNAYEFFSDLNAKVIQFKKEYNSKNFEITRGDNDIMLGLQYAKYAILDTSKKIERDSNKEAIIKTATQLIRVAKSSDLDIDVSNNIGKRAIDDLVFFADENDITPVDIQSVDEIILNNPKLIEEYDILRVEYNPDGTRKTYNEIIADRDEKRTQIEENGSITLASTRNSLLRQLDKGYAQVLYNEIINQYKANRLEGIIEKHGEQVILDEINKIIKYREDDIKDVELRKTNIENYMERNDKVLNAELTASTLSEFKQVVGDVDIEGEFIEESVKSDELLQASNMDILNNIHQDLEYRIKVREEQEIAEREQRKIQTRPEQEPEQPKEDKKDKTDRRNTNVFININKSRTDNSTNNTTNNTTNNNTTVQQDENDHKKTIDDEDEPVIVHEPKYVEGPAGKDGEDGRDGDDGRNGYDGDDGNNGNNGTDGKNGKNGANGQDGKNGKNKNVDEEPKQDINEEPNENNDIDDLKNRIAELSNTIDELKSKPNLDTSILIGIEQLKSLYKKILEKNNGAEIADLKKMIEDLQTKIDENQKGKVIDDQQEPATPENGTVDLDDPEVSIEEPVLVEPTIPEEEQPIVDQVQDEITPVTSTETEDKKASSVTNNTNINITINENGAKIENKNPILKDENKTPDNVDIEELRKSKEAILEWLKQQNEQEIEEFRKGLEEKADKIIEELDLTKVSLDEMYKARRHLDAKIAQDVASKRQQKEESFKTIQEIMEKYITKKELADKLNELNNVTEELKTKRALIESIETETTKSLEAVEDEIKSEKDKITKNTVTKEDSEIGTI